MARSAARQQEVEEPRDIRIEVGDEDGGLNLKTLKEKKISELARIARGFSVDGTSGLRKQDLIFSILQPRPSRAAISTVRACWKFCPTGLASCAPRITTTCLGPTISTSLRVRFGASICAPAMSSPARFVHPKRASATLRSSRSRSSTTRNRSARAKKILFDNLTPLYPEEPLRLEYDPRRIPDGSLIC